MALKKVVYYTDTSDKPCLYKNENGVTYVLMNSSEPYWDYRDNSGSAWTYKMTFTKIINWDKLLSRNTYDEWKKEVERLRKEIFYNEILNED